MSGPVPWRIAADGVVLIVRVTPKGGRDAVERVEQMADGRSVLKVRVRAAAGAGAANAALVRLLGEALDVPSRDIDVTAGQTARVKRINIRGPQAALIGALEKISAIR